MQQFPIAGYGHVANNLSIYCLFYYKGGGTIIIIKQFVWQRTLFIDFQTGCSVSVKTNLACR